MLVHRYVVHHPIIPAAHILRLPSHLRHFQDFTDDGSRMRTARDSIYWIGRGFHYELLLDAIALLSLTKFVQKQPLEKNPPCDWWRSFEEEEDGTGCTVISLSREVGLVLFTSFT